MGEGFRKGKIPKRFENMSDDKKIIIFDEYIPVYSEEAYVEHILRHNTDLIVTNQKLNKALDKACEVLENDYGRFIVPDDERLFWKAEQWKEWCMKDE